MSSISQMNPQQKALFAAYTRLTVVNRAEAEYNGTLVTNKSDDQLSFTDFEKDMSENKVVDKNLARNLPSQVLNELKNEQNITHNPFYENELNLVQKAYQLGLVGQNNLLVSRSHVLSSYQNSI